jgi:NADH-quinone oxidoreductase subunit I
MARIIKNFFISFGNIFRRTRTIIYPKEKMIIPEVSKGLPRLKLDLDTLKVICNGCGRCEKICPQNCIKVEKIIGNDGRESLEEFCLDLNKCIFCGNCVEVCELGAIEMSYKYQLAEYNAENLKLEKLDLAKQADHNLRDFWLR